MNYTRDFSKLESLVNELENQTDIIKNVDSWLKEYKVSQYHPLLSPPLTSYPQAYVELETGGGVDWDNMSEEAFLGNLTQFLFSPRGARYKNQLKFSSSLECGAKSPHILVSTVNYQHVGFQSASEWVPAMDRVTNLVEASNISVSDKLLMLEDSEKNLTDAVFPVAMR